MFVHDDDLWSSSLDGGAARRITTSRAHVSHPRLSPDGTRIAYVAADEGLRDAYLVDLGGGPPRRLTWEGDVGAVCGWSEDGSAAIVATSARQPFNRPTHLWQVPVDGGPVKPLPLGPAIGWAQGPHRQVVLCRHTDDLARWKRYRGGRTGSLWIDREGDGSFERLIELPGNVACPTWVGDRVWFVSDHEYWGNLYSVTPSGEDLRKHTDHTGFFVRHPSSDGAVLVYSRGGDLLRIDADSTAEPIAIDVNASADQSRRRFVEARRYLQGQDLHPDGSSIALEVRGRPFAMAHWEGPVRQLGARDGVRYRLPRWTAEGELLLASDSAGVDGLELHGSDEPRSYHPEALGRPVDLACAPVGRLVAVANHRQQLGVLDLDDGSFHVLDQAPGGPIQGMAWSPDGAWLAWSRPEQPGMETSRICLWNTHDRQVLELTDGRHWDWCPSWDPDGELLYFLSRREFDPVYDTQFFDLNFPRGSRPWAVTLRADAPHPFRARARAIDQKTPPARRRKNVDVTIDIEGLRHRMVPMPIKESIYDRLVGLPGGNLLMTRKGPHGSIGRNWASSGPPKADKVLVLWDANKRELVSVEDKVSDFGVDLWTRSVWVQVGWKLRVIPTSLEKGKREELKKTRGVPAGRRSGWIDLNRIRCSIDPRAEWKQLFAETWRLVQHHFWDEGLSGVDWDAARERYEPLVDRVSTREELSDVLWTLIGELGTSHAYEIGGDLRSPPRWSPGRLGADWEWDPEREGWRVTRICRGDPGHPDRTSPLLEPGVGARVGDCITSVDGSVLAADRSPAQELAHRANQLVSLELERDGATRTVVVRALGDDRMARYREWVRTNRELVHERTDGRCGYVHIPDMGPGGYAEFHRDFGIESRRGGLVVDVRFNRGGHVSQLLLEKLARRPLAWTVSRWNQPQVYPRNASLGPMVCLTNENAGSDGDIFSHNWKQMDLGPLVGRRTWGGVVGIWPRHRMVDNSITTQPEFAYWFPDVRWGVENRGTEPDVDVDITPQDHAAGLDPQMEAALSWMVEQLDTDEPGPPDFGPGPYLGDPESR